MSPNSKRDAAEYGARRIRAAALFSVALSCFCLVANTNAANIAVFGDNEIDDFLNANGHTATVVSDGDLATPGFLNTFDVFIYTRDGSSFGDSLSAPAAANVAAFVTGNVVLFTSDLADNEFPGDATNTLMLNAVSFAGQKGYIGEFPGSCAAMSSNNQGLEPIGLIAGECSSLSFGPGGDPMTILQTDHPVVAGVPNPVNLGDSHEFFALVSVDQELIVAVNSEQNPSIVAGEGTGGSAQSRATFEVNKDFTDDNPGDVEVTISCNTGLPLEQSKVITEGEGVKFVVVDFDTGEMDCEITEDVPAGYDAEYFNGSSTSSTECEYLDVAWGAAFSCRITNTPAPVDVVIHKEWVIEGSSDADGVSQEYRIDLRCDSEIIGGNDYGDIWHIFWFDEGDATFVAEVIPDFPSTTCWVEEEVFDSAVEVDNGCGQFEVSANNGHECTITNTVFFEGIPTLNQYGLALLALLMLGVGFVGFRRLA
jgi:hypothetical protein